MHAIADQGERERIVSLARRYLEPHQPADYRLEVDADSIHQGRRSDHVVVVPSRLDIRSYDYSARLAEAELDMQEKEQVKVLLVPALPN